MEFNIALGQSRNSKKWQNKIIVWEDFVKRISTTHRTAETVSEYATFKKDRQDEIKDIGGFVGGYLANGRRLATSVTARSILTFDADEAETDFWQRFCLQYNCAAALYSTHKHTPENPRFRLIIPLSREVFADEYAAIVRRIAGHIGIDMFDHTGYQPHRLMYWPSTSKDGVFVFEEQKGELLDPDTILNSYKNWKDVSEWPTALREHKILDREAKKQGEPIEKPGLIGAFNRAYTITEAIDKFLNDVYEKTEMDNRYTYKEGSTAAGVIIYNDAFSYSHHGTDPTSNILCNAFDLVRLHKFHLLDIDTDVPINKRPSYVAMCDFVSNDKLVKQQIGEAKLEIAKEVFKDVYFDDEDTDWMKNMDVDRKSHYLPTINNIALILEFDPVFKNNIAYDEFEQQAVFKRDLPWRKIKHSNIINDNDLANIENYIEKVYKLSCGESKMKKGMLVVLEKFRFHPIRDYLNSCVWDGTPRVERLLIDYLGCSDNLYTRTVTKKSLVACVARVFVPGIKFDNVLTLVGEEGQGKSWIWDKLGGKWFSDTFNMHMLQSKEAYEQIQGVWLIEIGELAGMAKAEVERVKGFLAARQDRYRSPYLRTTEKRLRQCVYFASTNTFQFLKSQNGNRRFWPVPTYENTPLKVVYDLTQEEVNLIWAEALHLFKQGEKLYLNEEVKQMAIEMQEAYTEENPWVHIFQEYLSTKIPANWYDMSRWDKIEFLNDYKPANDLTERSKICAQELWEIALHKKEQMEIMDLKKIKQTMEKIKGWVRENENIRFGKSYPRQKGAFVKKLTLESILN